MERKPSCIEDRCCYYEDGCIVLPEDIGECCPCENVEYEELFGDEVTDH